MDFLKPNIDRTSLLQMSSSALAHIGDGVFELMVRSYMALEGKHTSTGLHKSTVQIVRASFQASRVPDILPILTEEEMQVYRRAKNTKIHIVPKSTTRRDYSLATGLEALFGWLYLQMDYDRLNYIFSIVIDIDKENM